MQVDCSYAIQLQPHEGSSETVDPGRYPAVVGELQPHEGSSETGDREEDEAATQMRLQPHEGSSETCAVVGALDESSASTPRGFV